MSIKNESGKAGGWVNIKASREELYNRIAKKNRIEGWGRRLGKKIGEEERIRKTNKRNR